MLAVVDERALAGPELPEHFERTVWARLEPDLRRARGGWASWLAFSPGRLAWVATVVLLVGAAFMAGRLLPAFGATARATTDRLSSANGFSSSISASISIGRRWCWSSS